MALEKGEASARDQREIGAWMQSCSKRSERGRRWPWQTTRGTFASPQETPESPPFTPYPHTDALVSEGLGTENLGVKASPADSAQLADENVEKPWYILRGISASVTRQRQKIPLIFRKFRAEVSIEEIHKGPESGVASSSLAPWGIWNDQPVSHGKGILATNAFHGNAVEGGSQDFNVPSLGDRMHRRDSNGKVRKGTAFMAKSSLGEEENLVGLSVIEDTQGPASRAGGPRHETQCDERTQKMPGQAYEPFSPVAGSAGESWQTEESSHNYQPRPQTKDRTDSTEFVSSAIMIRCPNGEQDSAKMFYDTMSTDNIVSRKFVEKYGFIERPFHPDDLKVYDTLVGAFAPTHYVEIELKDTERDIKEFTKVSFNVAESMNGIGLLAGREFMIKHGVSLNAKEGPGAFVVTSREADEDAKKAQKLLLDQTATAMEKAKGYAASGAGSSTTASTGTSQAQHVAASSQTSTSSGANNNSSQNKK